MEGEQFNYYFEHGEFMPENKADAKKARDDDSIERPARHISMTDGYAEDAPEGEAASTDETGTPAAPEAPAEAEAPMEPAPQEEDPGKDNE